MLFSPCTDHLTLFARECLPHIQPQTDNLSFLQVEVAFRNRGAFLGTNSGSGYSPVHVTWHHRYGLPQIGHCRCFSKDVLGKLALSSLRCKECSNPQHNNWTFAFKILLIQKSTVIKQEEETGLSTERAQSHPRRPVERVQRTALGQVAEV